MDSSLSSTPGKSTTSRPSMLLSRLYMKGTVVRFTSVVPVGIWWRRRSRICILQRNLNCRPFQIFQMALVTRPVQPQLDHKYFHGCSYSLNIHISTMLYNALWLLKRIPTTYLDPKECVDQPGFPRIDQTDHPNCCVVGQLLTEMVNHHCPL